LRPSSRGRDVGSRPRRPPRLTCTLPSSYGTMATAVVIAALPIASPSTAAVQDTMPNDAHGTSSSSELKEATRNKSASGSRLEEDALRAHIDTPDAWQQPSGGRGASSLPAAATLAARTTSLTAVTDGNSGTSSTTALELPCDDGASAGMGGHQRAASERSRLDTAPAGAPRGWAVAGAEGTRTSASETSASEFSARNRPAGGSRDGRGRAAARGDARS
jgi:hypothetical protein